MKDFGIDVDKLEPQFEGCVEGRTLILDADSACYAASADAVKYETAARRFVTAIHEAMFLTKADHCRAHLTPKGCMKNNRMSIIGAKPYQGNRQGKNKPPLLEMLRDNAGSLFGPQENIQVYGHYQYEADDAVMMDAYQIEDAVVWSEDKDLNIVPCGLWVAHQHKVIPIDNRYGYLYLRKTPSGKTKVTGRGTSFFWYQMLAGDGADNVKGILSYKGRLCGEIGAYTLLKNITDESEAANLVLDGYRAIDQNPIPEGWFLWLLRWPGDTCYDYFLSLDLSNNNREYLQECYEREWFKLEEAIEESA
jgi:hypothetical protein